LPGDALVAASRSSDTRGITIDAPPELIWPWLVQMGYGRGGWYSIDQLDMRGSRASRIVDEWQRLALGDVVPTHPGGGFAVKVLEPNRALVLYADTATPGDFAASWAFVLEPIGANRTRLIERVRYWGAEGSPLSNVALSALGFGVFVMVQRQMTGIRARAERLALEMRPGPAATGTAPAGNGQAAHVPDTILATVGPG
jgi:hypothetical protein